MGGLGQHQGGELWDQFTGAQQTKDANKANIELANTAVQRRKADLLAAGFNPLLAVGDAAQSPTMQALPSQASGISSAVNAYKTYGASKLMDSQSRAAEAQSAQSISIARKNNADAQFQEQINAGGGADKQLQKTDAVINELSEKANLARDQQDEVKAMVNQIKEHTDLLHNQAWVEKMKYQAEKMDAKAKMVAYEVLLRTAVNEIERAQKEYTAIQGAAGTTGANIRESSIGGGAGAAALIKSIFFGR